MTDICFLLLSWPQLINEMKCNDILFVCQLRKGHAHGDSDNICCCSKSLLNVASLSSCSSYQLF